MTIENHLFGKTQDDAKVDIVTITNRRGLSIQLIPYGATLTSVRTPDISGNFGEITLGFDTLEGYLGDHPYFGATIGRVANRIEQARFQINRRVYTLARNAGANSLHGGKMGFNRFVWESELFGRKDGAGVSFNRISPHGEEGYPGTMKVTVTYLLNENNELRIDYEATTDRVGPINLTNHTYWNLSGEGAILDHQLVLYADRYLTLNEELIPDGEINSVKLTALDFRNRRVIGERLADVPGGYDFCYVLGSPTTEASYPLENIPPGMHPAAMVIDPKSKRTIEVFTTKPGMELYTGNYLEGVIGRDGKALHKHDALCLETQYFPNAVNLPQFPSILLKRGATYNHSTVYRFGVYGRPTKKTVAKKSPAKRTSAPRKPAVKKRGDANDG